MTFDKKNFDIFRYRHIVFDFDGVLAETNEIRINGFRQLFKEYPQKDIDKIVSFVSVNGGLSRYEKIRYFFEDIRNEAIVESKIIELAQKFSGIVKEDVVQAHTVEGAQEFLARLFHRFEFAVISGSDQEELRDVCQQRNIEQYFVEILGSPLTKEENLKQLIIRRQWRKEHCLFIGDSINDLNAAKSMGIDFIGRNSGMADWSKHEDVMSFDDMNQLVDIAIY